jgi:hypothetical protein
VVNSDYWTICEGRTVLRREQLEPLERNRPEFRGGGGGLVIRFIEHLQRSRNNFPWSYRVYNSLSLLTLLYLHQSFGQRLSREDVPPDYRTVPLPQPHLSANSCPTTTFSRRLALDWLASLVISRDKASGRNPNKTVSLLLGNNCLASAVGYDVIT